MLDDNFRRDQIYREMASLRDSAAYCDRRYVPMRGVGFHLSQLQDELNATSLISFD